MRFKHNIGRIYKGAMEKKMETTIQGLGSRS